MATAMKSAFEDSIANTRALLGAKDVQEFVSLQNSFAQPALEKAIAGAYANIRKIRCLASYYRTDVGQSLWPPGNV